MIYLRLNQVAGAAVVAAGIAMGIAAGATALASDPVVLTVDAGGEPRAMTMADLDATPQREVVTATEFTEGETTFRGPLVRDVLTPPPGATVAVMRAINDYAVEIPLADFEAYDVILATSMNGQPLSRRDKGPIWVMYPIDDHAELSDPVFLNRLIWQLDRVAFK